MFQERTIRPARDRAEPAVDDERERLAEWIEAVAGGDRDAFASIYHASAPRLLGIALRMTKERALAEEVLQEAFLALWQRAGSYRQELGHPMAWLATIVRHRAIDRLRSQRSARETAVGTCADLDGIPAAPVTDSDGAVLVEQSILRCLETLKEPTRKAILLGFYGGLTHEELARALGRPLGTIKSDMRRGLAALRLCLES